MGLFLSGNVVQRLLQLGQCARKLFDAAEDAASDLGLAAELIEGRKLQHLRIFNVLHAMIGELVEQCIQNRTRLLAILAEHITLAHAVRTLAAGQRCLVEGHVGHQIEGVQLVTVGHRLLQHVQRHTLLR